MPMLALTRISEELPPILRRHYQPKAHHWNRRHPSLRPATFVNTRHQDALRQPPPDQAGLNCSRIPLLFEEKVLDFQASLGSSRTRYDRGSRPLSLVLLPNATAFRDARSDHRWLDGSDHWDDTPTELKTFNLTRDQESSRQE